MLNAFLKMRREGEDRGRRVQWFAWMCPTNTVSLCVTASHPRPDLGFSGTGTPACVNFLHTQEWLCHPQLLPSETMLNALHLFEQ